MHVYTFQIDVCEPALCNQFSSCFPASTQISVGNYEQQMFTWAHRYYQYLNNKIDSLTDKLPNGYLLPMIASAKHDETRFFAQQIQDQIQIIWPSLSKHKLSKFDEGHWVMQGSQLVLEEFS